VRIDWGHSMALVEKKINSALAKSYISPLLDGCVGLAAQWLESIGKRIVTALVPEEISEQHLLNFDEGGFPLGATSSFLWMQDYLKTKYLQNEKDFIIVFQDIWSNIDDPHSDYSWLEYLAGVNGIYYLSTIDETLIENFSNAVWSGNSFFTLGFVIEKPEIIDHNIINELLDSEALKSCPLVIFGAYDQESFLLFKR